MRTWTGGQPSPHTLTLPHLTPHPHPHLTLTLTLTLTQVQSSDFLDAYKDKGRMSNLVTSVPLLLAEDIPPDPNPTPTRTPIRPRPR